MMLSIMKEKKTSSEVKESVLELKKEFNQIKYGFQNLEEVIKNC